MGELTEPASDKTRRTLSHLRDASVRGLAASERAVERGFNEARLMLSLAAGLLLVGFLLVAQWRGNQTFERSLDRQSDQSLAQIIQESTAENTSLRSEILRLQLRIAEAEKATRDRTEVFNEGAKELRALSVVAGLQAASGPGVRVTMADPERVLLPQDFVALVQELRAGGAEAIAVNGVRIAALSGFSGRDGSIRIDETVQSRDFEIVAIGDPQSLQQSLTLPGGLQSTLSTFPGVEVVIESVYRIQVPAAKRPAFDAGTPYEER